MSKLVYLYKVYCLRDSFLWSSKKWFEDNNIERFRLDYTLNDTSIVFDVGAYLGDYAEAINQKFGCNVYSFEPVPLFYTECAKRFSHNSSIVCLNYGLSSKSGWFEIELDDNASSLKKTGSGSLSQLVQVRSITEVFAELGLNKIDLIKIQPVSCISYIEFRP